MPELYDYTQPLFFQRCDGIGAKASYALCKVHRRATKAVRVRDDNGTESDIGFSGNDLDTTALLTTFLQRNLVSSIPLGVDADADGVSTGWSAVTEAPITVTNSIDTATQKIEITGGSDTTKIPYVYADVTCVVGNTVTITGLGKCNAGIQIRARISWYAGASFISASSGTYATNADYATITVTGTAPATATKARIRFDVNQVVAGNLGSAWFKSASVTISNQSAYVTTWYDQSGNNNHAVQTTAANQPRLVNAGVLEVNANGTPCIQTILASDTHFVVADNALLDFTTNVSVSIVHNPASLGEGSGGRILEKASAYIFALQSATSIYTINTLSTEAFGNGSIVLGANNINTIRHDSNANTFKLHKNGVLINSVTATARTGNTNNLYLFNRAAGDRQYDGKISELILFDSTLTDAQRIKLERSQGTYYGVTVT